MKRIRLREVVPARVVWMGGGGGNANADAATQAGFNREAAILGQQLNRYNIESPYGSTRFSGQTLKEKLSPKQQKIFNQRQKADLILAQQAAGQAERYGAFQARNQGQLDALAQSELGAASTRAKLRGDALGRLPSGQFDPSAQYRTQGVDNLKDVEGFELQSLQDVDGFNLSSLQNLDTNVQGANVADLQNVEGFNLSDLQDVDRYGQREQDLGRKSVEEALFSRLNPQFDRDREGLEARLAAQGVSSGSEAYMREMDELRRANTDARFQATMAGGQEQSRLEGLRQAELGRRLGVRGQEIGQRTAIRGQELGIRGTELERRGRVRSDELGRRGGVRTSELERRRMLRQQILEEELAKRRVPFDELSALEQ